MPIERTRASRSLAVIIEILQPAGDRTDVSDSELIAFAESVVQTRITNERWAFSDRIPEHIQFDQLPVLGSPAREEDKLIGWVVEVSR
jgi:hypothetical protein